jgi:hypothetical protein
MARLMTASGKPPRVNNAETKTLVSITTRIIVRALAALTPCCRNFRVNFFHREFIGALCPGVLLEGCKPFWRSGHRAHADLLSFGNGATEQAFDSQLLVG